MDNTRKVTSIGESAFYECTGLTSITIPNSITSMGESAFYHSVTSITIPNSVTMIGNAAFAGCSVLTSITIPNSVTSIGKNALYEVSLSTIISQIENPFAIDGDISSPIGVFTVYTLNHATLYVPEGTIDKYKTTYGWRNFKNIVEGIPSGIKGILLDNDKDSPIYDINGRRLEDPQRGINIINGKKVVNLRVF